jgi:hypothetical protein
MQSVLQYRRFEKRLCEQVKRHGVDATAGVIAPGPNHANYHFDPASGTKDVEAGLVPLAESRDHAVEEKDMSDRDFEAPQADNQPDGNAFGREEKLSGSTTRRSSTSTANSTRPDLSTATTQETVGTRLGQALTGINVRSRRTNEGRHEKGGKVFVVGYVDEKDPLNPHNWSILKRMSITFLVASIGLIVGFASSVDSAALQQARIEFGVSEVTESLATGIYLIGFGCGCVYKSYALVKDNVLTCYPALSLLLQSRKP